MIMDFDGLINWSIEIFLIDWLSFLRKRLRDVGLVTLQILLVIKSASKQAVLQARSCKGRERSEPCCTRHRQRERGEERRAAAAVASMMSEWVSEWVSELSEWLWCSFEESSSISWSFWEISESFWGSSLLLPCVFPAEIRLSTKLYLTVQCCFSLWTFFLQ